jgi:hypothetical protein
MTLALGSGLGMVGQAATLDARVQLAADAAALAAVAESAPGSSGHPEDHARRYAEANGARLIECICVPGSSAMQVRVAIGDAAATARAVFEAELLVPAAPEGSNAGSG